MNTLNYGSLFTGIGGFEVGFGQTPGLQCTSMTEWNNDSRKVLSTHFPNLPLMGDIKDVQGPDLGRIDLLAGGFPCKDTAIAAPNRLGLAGSRSKHFWDFVRLLAEYQRLIDATNPRWVVIENTPGLLKSPGRTGRDMATVVRALEELGYGWAYRVVDGRYLGTGRRRTVQRRQRVLVVGHLGGDPRPAGQVLGLVGSGGSTGGANPVGGPTRGPVAAGAPAQGAVIWRKSARPRKALSLGGYETWTADGIANTLTGFDGGLATRQTHLVGQHGRVRTFTPLEWERLQGFADDWTAMVKSDGSRFQMLGDAIHTGTSEWLGRNLMRVHSNLPLIGKKAA